MVGKVVVTLGAVLMLASCGDVITSPSSSSATGAGNAPTSTPNSLKGPVGTPFVDTDSSNDQLTVTLTAVEDPAKGADQYTEPDAGSRFVAAKFTLTGKTGTFTDDANTDATLIGSDNQTYSPDYSDVAGCTNFDAGSYTVTPGETSVGCVVFQVPDAVKVAEIHWNAIFSSGAPAVWTVSP